MLRLKATQAIGKAHSALNTCPARLLTTSSAACVSSSLRALQIAPTAAGPAACSTSSAMLPRRVGPAARFSVVAAAGAGGAAAGDVKVDIEGMMCDGCSSRIENVLKGMDTVVASVKVDLEGKFATVKLAHAGDAAAAKQVVDAINELGFEAKLAK